jgi:aerobic-type carbon monoxide dehydrogenase small subunit (CoxS/CutS family)
MSEVTINGKPVKAVAGQKVSQVLASARTKVTYSCRKGDCGTCEIFMNGRVTKACNAKIPQGKCTIQTN